MLPQYYKYTTEQLEQHNYYRYDVQPALELYVSEDKFANILRIIFDKCINGDLCTDVSSLLSENTPIEVRNFVSNYLQSGIKTGQFDNSNLSDDYIFNNIIPRHYNLQESLNFIIDKYSHD
ncbi:hypothetical protein [Sigmofec virus UA08Rod_4301]|uniref:Uncharacterized protein n=1 Tax=Sigmofec virus UA08Rod_4301 TaxID=2929398 RepID=A0A976N158_9VIRU|nr:hypothetical protein [Sigmofec virus UA08Rod_4301]